MLTLKRWLPAVGLILCAVVLARLDLSSVRAALTEVEPGGLFLGQFLVTVMLLAKAVRHYYLLRAKGLAVPFGISTVIYFRSSFWGFVSPGRLGEFSRLGYLRDYSDSTLTSISTVVLDRVLDVTAVALFWLAALLLSDFPGREALIGLALTGVGLAVSALAAGRLLISRLQSGSRLAEAAQALFALRGKIGFLAVSLAIWGLYYLAFVIMAASIPVTAPVSYLVFCTASANVVAYLPLSVAGIGTRDALLIGLFAAVGLSSAHAILFSASFLVSYITSMALCLPFVLRRS